MAAGLIRHYRAVKGRHDPHFQKVERSPIRVGVTHHEATAERVVGVDLRILLSQQAREVGGEARREEFKRGNRHDRACDFLIAVGFLARRKVPFSAEEDFRLDEMKVRYLRCDRSEEHKSELQSLMRISYD